MIDCNNIRLPWLHLLTLQLFIYLNKTPLTAKYDCSRMQEEGQVVVISEHSLISEKPLPSTQ